MIFENVLERTAITTAWLCFLFNFENMFKISPMVSVSVHALRSYKIQGLAKPFMSWPRWQ